MVKLKKSYRFLRGLVRTFSHTMKTTWEEPYDGSPSVFCPNHAGAFGPIDMCAYFELCDNIRPWFNADVADEKLMPAYVRQDYWWKPGCRLKPLYNATLPYLAAVILPPIMRTTPGILVNHNEKVYRTFKESVDAISRGENLMIFPEQPAGYREHCEKLNEGWLLLGQMLYKKLGVKMRIYPVHVDHKAHLIQVKKPVIYNPDIPLASQKEEILKAISNGLF